MRRLNTATTGFAAELERLLRGEAAEQRQYAQTVHEILRRVRAEGDRAVVALTNKLDRLHVAAFDELVVPPERRAAALERIPGSQAAALRQAAARIRAYAERQKTPSWEYREADGLVLGQRVTPLQRVGVYVPGGQAAYPSSVLMNVIPARVAGVERVVMTAPTPDGALNDMVLAAATIAGVDEIYRIGGAQAIAALAYGTESIAPVDKIVGPGNIYVALAKRAVFGEVGIDMVAGPSEVLILCDGGTDPEWVAMDMFAQAEHDALAQAIAVCADADYLERVAVAIKKLLPQMPRKAIIEQSLTGRGALIRVTDKAEAIALANKIAPEHLQLSVAHPEHWLPDIRNAGAVFMGAYSTEVLGDYCAGPNHVLPTAGSARFSSALGVADFEKRTSIVHCTATAARKLAAIAIPLAEGEGLTAHARSAAMRLAD